MTSRRQILQIGVTGAALLPVARYADAWPAAAEAEPFYVVVFDARFPKSRHLAGVVAGPSARLAAIRGDVTALWYHDLYFAWQRDAAPVAGVTSIESLFCLELLARDAGMRVTLRQVVDNDLVSWAIGSRRSRR